VESIAGKCLIASPYLEDPNFRRTIVYIVSHDEEGAIGVILNRHTGRSFSDWLLSQGIKDSKSTHFSEFRIFRGGPVDDTRLIALHDQEGYSQHRSADGVAFTSLGEHLSALLLMKEIRCMIFVGYAGWGPGQLEEELRAGGWMVSCLSRDQIFSLDDQSWQSLVHRFGDQILGNVVPADWLRSDPHWN
jgi:putative transcriptional regulator